MGAARVTISEQAVKVLFLMWVQGRETGVIVVVVYPIGQLAGNPEDALSAAGPKTVDQILRHPEGNLKRPQFNILRVWIQFGAWIGFRVEA